MNKEEIKDFLEKIKNNVVDFFCVRCKNAICKVSVKSYLVVAGLLLCYFITTILHANVMDNLAESNVAKDWGNEEEKYIHVSSYFGKDLGLTQESIKAIEQTIFTSLTEAGIDTSGKEGRKFVSAYSSCQDLFLESDRTSVMVKTYGISKDFFVFHPIKVLSGTLPTNTDENTDSVILDVDTAWKLFGGIDVAGLKVNIGSRVYVISCVVERETGLFTETAGSDIPTIYVDYDVLNNGSDQMAPIVSYEILVQNPVADFGSTLMSDGLVGYEGSYEMVENTTRFSLASRLHRLKDFGSRSMSRNGIIYPYWENIARGYEDLSQLLLYLQLLLLIYPIFTVGRIIFYIGKHNQG